MSLLEAAGLVAGYERLEVLKQISLTVQPGEIVAVLGPNGAGKTTLMRTISRLIPARSGSIRFGGEDLTTLPAHKVVELGLVQVPEGRYLFNSLTVSENLRLGAFTRRKDARTAEQMENVFEVFPVLYARQRQLAGTLSGGEQQMLAIGRALMARPKMLLMDEPSMGLAPIIVSAIFDTLTRLNREGLAILLTEQNIEHALAIAHRAYVMEVGRIALEGPVDVFRKRTDLQDIYLGLSHGR